jgi:hypothetical protein
MAKRLQTRPKLSAKLQTRSIGGTQIGSRTPAACVRVAVPASMNKARTRAM